MAGMMVGRAFEQLASENRVRLGAARNRVQYPVSTATTHGAVSRWFSGFLWRG
ncbi:hypothetical protein BLL52_2967 [Rhodoferax antarcticus ANT.BR]|uniref:Uncharacterized protein n=1 Tax=Rhodoferax antarcticus ANT.BR TaxID=1111071 RepID=A0A1Q8YFF5_9BURK|nr:hypothetical protein BLL52_2967 [Rhodoferax antarcticus ANT.BR]